MIIERSNIPLRIRNEYCLTGFISQCYNCLLGHFISATRCTHRNLGNPLTIFINCLWILTQVYRVLCALCTRYLTTCFISLCVPSIVSMYLDLTHLISMSSDKDCGSLNPFLNAHDINDAVILAYLTSNPSDLQMLLQLSLV